MDVGPGDLVVATRDAGASTTNPATAACVGAACIVAGRIYTVREVYTEERIEGVGSQPAACLVLREPETQWTAWDGGQGSWAVEIFVPIRKPPIPAEILALQNTLPASPEPVAA